MFSVFAAYTTVNFGGQWHLTDYQFIFAIAIDSYKMLPFWAVNWMARILPWVEIFLGAGLIIGVGLRWIQLGHYRVFAWVFMGGTDARRGPPPGDMRLLRQQKREPKDGTAE